MGRRIRNAQVFDTFVIDLAEATADLVLDLVAPTEGALIDEVIVSVKTAGVGTGTYDLHIKEVGDGTVLTNTLAAGDADLAADTIMGTITGNGVGATKAGQVLELDVVENGTVSTGTVVILGVKWLT